MFPRPKFSITLCATFCTSLLFAATVAGAGTADHDGKGEGQRDRQHLAIEGQVVQVEGNGLLVKLSTGELKIFRVPETRRFFIDGKELSVHDLQPGTTLTATVKTTTTPVTVRTKSSAERQGVVHRGTHCDPDAGGRSKQTVLSERYRQHPVHGRGSPGDRI